MSSPAGYHNRPSHADVIRIAESTAFAAGIDPRMIYGGRSDDEVAARKLAWWQVLRETGCSMSGLADVWGIDRQAIWRAQKLLPAAEQADIRAAHKPRPLAQPKPKALRHTKSPPATFAQPCMKAVSEAAVDGLSRLQHAPKQSGVMA